MPDVGSQDDEYDIVGHVHCPDGHDHPQPMKGVDGNWYCSPCWFRHRELVVCVPCVPGENCR